MDARNDCAVSFSSDEAAALFTAMKRLESSLDAPGRAALAKLEKHLYEALSIEEMERLVREPNR